MFKKVLSIILIFFVSFSLSAFAVDSENLELLDENDYKKMHNAWHLTALYPPVYAVVGICNAVRIHKEKKKIKQHNREVLQRFINNNEMAKLEDLKTINDSAVSEGKQNKQFLDKQVGVNKSEKDTVNGVIDKELICLKIEHNIEYVFKIYASDLQKKTETALFYIDLKNKQVYRKDKIKVDYIKTFTDSQISFMIVDYTDKFKVCRCYDIDRYTGNVIFTLFEHPITLGAKFDQGILDIKDGYVANGKGFAEKVDISLRKF